MLTDTHCHLDFNKFDDDRDAVIQRALEAGVERILIPAIELESCKAVIRLANSHPNLFAAVGFHPTELNGWNDDSIETLRGMIFPHPVSLSQRERGWGEGKLVAIGEIGLDYYWQAAPREIQREALRAQLKLAAQTGLPVILHLREKDDALQGEAAADLLELLREWSAALQRENNPLAQRPGVLHSFSGSLETAQAALALGFFLGITGPVTYKNAEARREVVKSLPLERVLIETDSPFLAPVPQRGKRNEPAFVCAIADKIAEIHHLSPPELAAITSENARRLFGWG